MPSRLLESRHRWPLSLRKIFASRLVLKNRVETPSYMNLNGVHYVCVLCGRVQYIYRQRKVRPLIWQPILTLYFNHLQARPIRLRSMPPIAPAATALSLYTGLG